jgi:uncharacterized membrane protein YfcA
MDMTVAQLAVYLTATFAAALVTGLAGFAFGLIAAAIWLHVLTPIQSATLIVAFGLVVQGYSVWQLRHALRLRLLWPFLVSGVMGVPVGVSILGWARPDHVRVAVGIVLVLYSIHALARPVMRPVRGGGAAADAGVGFLNGALGGLTGFAGILIVIWCGLRGWSRDEQRAIFQPSAVAIFLMTALWLGMKGEIARDTVWLFLIGLPVLLLGTWLGLKLYGRLDEQGFRKIVLVLLLLSGIALIAPAVNSFLTG